MSIGIPRNGAGHPNHYDLVSECPDEVLRASLLGERGRFLVGAGGNFPCEGRMIGKMPHEDTERMFISCAKGASDSPDFSFSAFQLFRAFWRRAKRSEPDDNQIGFFGRPPRFALGINSKSAFLRRLCGSA
jgi:hypothetical protein